MGKVVFLGSLAAEAHIDGRPASLEVTVEDSQCAMPATRMARMVFDPCIGVLVVATSCLPATFVFSDSRHWQPPCFPRPKSVTLPCLVWRVSAYVGTRLLPPEVRESYQNWMKLV